MTDRGDGMDVSERRWTIFGFPTLDHGALTVRRGHGHAVPIVHEAVELTEAAPSPARGAVGDAQDPSTDLANVNAAYVIERDDNARLRAGISWARGMCTDSVPRVLIDEFLGRLLSPAALDEERDDD